MGVVEEQTSNQFSKLSYSQTVVRLTGFMDVSQVVTTSKLTD